LISSPGFCNKKKAFDERLLIKSATTSRAGGLRKAPGRDLPLLVVADFSKEF
jgi:hypothetical protein